MSRLLLAALLALAAAPAAARPVPALTGPVVDEAGVLDAGERRALDALSRAAWEQDPARRVQLQYLVVGSLEGDAIEDFAVRAFEQWKLGERGRDNGVLVVVAVKDRRVRIETGYGAEGGLTDAQSGRIIRGTLAPAFREGRYGQGLYDAGVQILGALGALPEGTQDRHAARPLPATRFSSLALVGFVLVVLFLRMLTGFGPRRRRGFWYGGWGGWGGGLGGGWGGGWGGGLGGGGGGWGGGGGRSGGGGASGSW